MLSYVIKAQLKAPKVAFLAFRFVFMAFIRASVRKYLTTEVLHSGCRNLSLAEVSLTNILDSLTYWPAEYGLFSTSGCKRVANRLDLYQEELEEQNEL